MLDGQIATLSHEGLGCPCQRPMVQAAHYEFKRWRPVLGTGRQRYIFSARRLKSSQALPVKEDRASRRQMASWVSSS